MKKLIALILILVITSFIVVSNEEEPLNIKIAIENSRNPNPKNKNWEWEYVKDRLFDGETENVYKLKGPILIDLTNATKQDSLAVEEIIKELRVILPHKTIDYFKNFVGKSFENIKSNAYNKKIKGIPLYQLVESTIKLNFTAINSGVSRYRITRVYNDNEIERSEFTKDGESIYNEKEIIFNLNKAIPYEKRKQYIQYECLRMLCYINPNKNYQINYKQNGIFETPDYLPDQTKFNELDQFLLQKLYSDDFMEQFKTYMYANYPWRYARSFINKKIAEFEAFGIIISVGILAFVLMLSYFQNRKFKCSYLNYLFPTFLVFIYFLNFANLYKYLTDFNSIISWDNNILFELVLSILAAALIAFLLWGLEKVSSKENRIFSFELVLKVIFTFISFMAPPIIIIFLLESGVKNAYVSIFPYLFFTLALAMGRGVLLYLNHFSESLVKEKDVELSRLKEAKAQAEVKVLQSQINPHFLYNALNSIASLAHIDADKTEKMALSLSDLFRHSINRKGKKVNTLEDEVSLLRNYLEIEQIRFGDRLKFTIAIEADLLAVEIPKFILQPLVENAIKHGVSKIEDQGEIILKVNKKDNGILISVQDNGPDFPEGLVSGHGLQTVYDLLKLSYGDKAAISWHNQPKKEITIYIADILK